MVDQNNRDRASADADQNLIAALNEAHERIRDLSARNEILVLQLEALPASLDAQIRSLREQVAAANDRATEAQHLAQELANSRIWRILVRLGGIFSPAARKSR